jgi:hypothetical protein
MAGGQTSHNLVRSCTADRETFEEADSREGFTAAVTPASNNAAAREEHAMEYMRAALHEQ